MNLHPETSARNPPIPSIPQPGRQFRAEPNKGPRHVSEILAELPIVQLIRARLDDPAYPTPTEVADAQHALTQARVRRQEELPLTGAG
jgi:hypothetical protein